MGGASHRWRELFAFPPRKDMYMEIKDFRAWAKDKKDINNNLAVFLYRKFCKEYGIKFHFGDEKYSLDKNIIFEIRLKETPLHGQALSLFNFINQPYHAHKGNLVSFIYTSWDNFDYEKINTEEIAKTLSKKESEIAKLESLFISCYITTLIVTFVLAVLIFSSLFFVLPVIFVVGASPWLVYILGEKIKLWRFNRKLNKLKYQLKNISDKYENK